MIATACAIAHEQPAPPLTNALLGPSSPRSRSSWRQTIIVSGRLGSDTTPARLLSRCDGPSVRTSRLATIRSTTRPEPRDRPQGGGHTCLRFRLCLANTAWVLSARRPSFKRLGSRDVPGFDLAMAMSTCDCGRVVRGRDKADEETVVVVRYEGEFPMEVKGESHYQEAIRECVAGASAEISSDDACSCEFSVRLVREPENPHDANAVAVRSLGDRTLGYLPRAVAPEYALVLDRLHGFAVVECSARAYGRRDRSGDPWNFGIWLDLPDASEFAHAVDLGYETIRGTNGRERDAIHADSGTELMVAVSCPACGAVAEAAPEWVGFAVVPARTMFGSSTVAAAISRARSMAPRSAAVHSSSAAATVARRTRSRSRAFVRSMLRSAGWIAWRPRAAVQPRRRSGRARCGASRVVKRRPREGLGGFRPS